MPPESSASAVWQPPGFVFESKAEEKRRSKMVLSVFGVGLLVYSVYTTLASLEGRWGSLMVVALGWIVWLSSAMMNQRRKYARLSSQITVFGILAVLGLGAQFDGQTDSPVLWLVPLCPMLAAYLLGQRAWLRCTVLAALTILAVVASGYYWPVESNLPLGVEDMMIYRGVSVLMFSGFGIIVSVTVQSQINGLRIQSETLEHARQNAESAATAKSRFLANMSHEIRTPMHGIFGTTHLLYRVPELDEQEKDAVETMLHCGETLLDHLTDVLDYSKLEAGKFSLRCQPVSPRRFLAQIERAWQPRMKRAGVHFCTKLRGPNDLWVLADHLQLKRVTGDLLDNAIRYGKQSPVILEINCVQEQEKVLFEMVVRDRGPGISEEEKARLMAPFERGLGQEGDRLEGLGLGLSLSARLVRLMEGKLEVDSQKGRGLRVMVTTRFDVATAPRPRFKTDAIELIPKGLPVLVADDHPINLTIARAELLRLGCTVVEAKDGQEAVARAKEQPFGLILMDLQMPNMTGWEAGTLISRGQGPNANTPIVALSAEDHRDPEELASRGCMVGHLCKPYSSQMLRDVVQAHHVDPKTAKAS